MRIPHGRAVWIVAAPTSEIDRRSVQELTGYVTAVLQQQPKLVTRLTQITAGEPAIVLLRAGETAPLSAQPPAGSPESFAITNGTSANHPIIVIAGATDRGLKRGIQRLIIKSRQVDGGLEFPDINVAEKPWIPEREWAICPWVPQHVRGAFVNPYADNRMNIWLFSDRQLHDYVSMYDWFGFSGVQLIETSYSYAVLGSPEAFHGRERRIAEAAKENGQQVSLWVWAAEFNSYGWLDPDVVYEPRKDTDAFDDLRVRRGFEKYYDYYATLAPLVDRLIGHFYDPGHLTDRRDVFRYMRLLEAKFRAKNPNVKLAIDSWGTSHDYLQALIDNGFTDYLLLEMSMPSLFKPGQREQLHSEAKRLGLKLGVWGWYTTEYETDQLASMYVNSEVLGHFYRRMRDGALKIYPVQYWSEMEAHHVNNIYSLYSAGQLLWNPDRSPDEILSELTEAIWGPTNGPKVLQAVKLIQDVRSGPSWETYWWTMPSYRLGTADANDDLRRATSAIENLRNLQPDTSFVPKLPLPYTPGILIGMMLPHLEQIRKFAIFRQELENIKEATQSGLGGEALSKRLSAAWQPIPEYNTWIGTFGQPEARMQEILLRKLASDSHVPLVEPAWLVTRECERLLEKIHNLQLRERKELRFKAAVMNEFHWPQHKLQDRLNKLVRDGAVEKLGPDEYRLSDWEQLVR
jgi:hypothetical protein